MLPMAAIVAGVVLINLHAQLPSAHPITGGNSRCWGCFAPSPHCCAGAVTQSRTPCSLKTLPYNNNQWSLLIGLCTGSLRYCCGSSSVFVGFPVLIYRYRRITKTILGDERGAGCVFFVAGVYGVESCLAPSGIVDGPNGGFLNPRAVIRFYLSQACPGSAGKCRYPAVTGRVLPAVHCHHHCRCGSGDGIERLSSSI